MKNLLILLALSLTMCKTEQPIVKTLKPANDSIINVAINDTVCHDFKWFADKGFEIDPSILFQINYSKILEREANYVDSIVTLMNEKQLNPYIDEKGNKFNITDSTIHITYVTDSTSNSTIYLLK